MAAERNRRRLIVEAELTTQLSAPGSRAKDFCQLHQKRLESVQDGAGDQLSFPAGTKTFLSMADRKKGEK